MTTAHAVREQDVLAQTQLEETKAAVRWLRDTRVKYMICVVILAAARILIVISLGDLAAQTTRAYLDVQAKSIRDRIELAVDPANSTSATWWCAIAYVAAELISLYIASGRALEGWKDDSLEKKLRHMYE